MQKGLMNQSCKFFKRFAKRLGFSNNETNSFDYIKYWDCRYGSKGNSGIGSIGVLAEYKAKIINDFVKNNQVNTVIEFGCGDGCQLELSNYPQYLGLDVAISSVELCQKKFADDPTKNFMLYNPRYFSNHGFLSADLVLCLDVLYHIIDENDFIKTINDVFNTAQKHVILYTNIKPQPSSVSHIIYRDTCDYLENYTDFHIDQIIEQKYSELTTAQFVFLSRIIEKNEGS
jgi:2-polyprenyl-3-methyl-5-hydroxy-6-metoxy-1,4-benzoquinol methylase